MVNENCDHRCLNSTIDEPLMESSAVNKTLYYQTWVLIYYQTWEVHSYHSYGSPSMVRLDWVYLFGYMPLGKQWLTERLYSWNMTWIRCAEYWLPTGQCLTLKDLWANWSMVLCRECSSNCERFNKKTSLVLLMVPEPSPGFSNQAATWGYSVDRNQV